MTKLKKGWEDRKFYGVVGNLRFKGKRLGDMTPDELQAILDADPKNSRQMIDGTPSKAVPKTDNKPAEPPPPKP
jgi:hypothetical protein